MPPPYRARAAVRRPRANPVFQGLPPAVGALAEKARDYWTFSGRATRLEYWRATLIIFGSLMVTAFILLIVLKVLSEAHVVRGHVGYHLTDGNSIAIVYELSYFVGFLGSILLLPVSVRRLHDHGVSGWVIALFVVLGVIPFLRMLSGFGSFIWFGCLPGTAGPNKYGPDPLAASRLPAGQRTGQGL